mgnify:CR=1 FL=1
MNKLEQRCEEILTAIKANADLTVIKILNDFLPQSIVVTLKGNYNTDELTDYIIRVNDNTVEALPGCHRTYTSIELLIVHRNLDILTKILNGHTTL